MGRNWIKTAIASNKVSDTTANTAKEFPRYSPCSVESLWNIEFIPDEAQLCFLLSHQPSVSSPFDTIHTRHKFLSHSQRSRELANRKIADVRAIRITWQSRDTLMSTLKKNKRQKWEEETRIASRGRIKSLLFDGSRLRFNYCAWLDLWFRSRVAFEKDYFFPVSESSGRCTNSRLNRHTESARLNMNSHARRSIPEQSVVNCNFALGSLKAFV